MIVVADTSAISNLLTIGHEGILRDLFGIVIVPPAVESELRAWHPLLPAFLSVKSPENPSVTPEFSQVLDLGEIEAISLALEIHANLLLIDERKGRAEAHRLGLKITGLLGVLLEAKKTGLIERLAPVLDELIDSADFRISAEVKSEFLHACRGIVSVHYLRCAFCCGRLFPCRPTTSPPRGSSVRRDFAHLA